MNPWDIDPSLYAAFWRALREWYLRRQADKEAAKRKDDAVRAAGCRA